jgi:excisionase family DNA binding protein
VSTAARVQAPIAATDEERSDVARVAQFLAERLTTSMRLVGVDGEEIILPTVAVQALVQAMRILSVEQSIAMWPVHEELTTKMAAKLLNVRHIYLLQVLDAGELPSFMVGTERRVRVGDLLLYAQARDERRRDALQQLTELSEELGLYDQ